MSAKKSILYIHAITALHPGSGHALGVVDLPVQRERHTQWPLIPSSSIKGVLRDACRAAVDKTAEEADSDPQLVAAFGPPTSDAAAHAGALQFTDARLLAYPVRSLKGVFAWVTCPAVLERFSRDLRLAGKSEMSGIDKLIRQLGSADKHQAIPCAASPLPVGADKERRIVLEEFEFTPVDPAIPEDIIRAVQIAADDASTARVATHLVIVHDDHFTHFVRHATEVTARIGLEYEQKTVKGGALFYQEFLPAECLFYSVVIANPGRDKGRTPSEQVHETLIGGIGTGMLQFGGNETIGRGFCAVKLS